MLILPWEYTEREGGTFIRWTGGIIDRESIPPPRRRASTVLLNGITVHSFIIGPYEYGTDYYARWDCVNGWTRTVYQAMRSLCPRRKKVSKTSRRKRRRKYA